MHRLHVILHLVRPGELLAAHGAREHLSLMALVVEERVPLEAVFVFERLLDVEFRALGALVNALGYRGVTKEIQAAHRHLGQLFGGILGVRGRATPHASLWHLAARRRGHRADLMPARRRVGGRRGAAAAAATPAAVLRVVAASPCRGRNGGTSRRRGRGGRCAGTGRGTGRGAAGRRARRRR